jgi:hypothetical protein
MSYHKLKLLRSICLWVTPHFFKKRGKDGILQECGNETSAQSHLAAELLLFKPNLSSVEKNNPTTWQNDQTGDLAGHARPVQHPNGCGFGEASAARIPWADTPCSFLLMAGQLQVDICREGPGDRPGRDWQETGLWGKSRAIPRHSSLAGAAWLLLSRPKRTQQMGFSVTGMFVL